MRGNLVSSPLPTPFSLRRFGEVAELQKALWPAAGKLQTVDSLEDDDGICSFFFGIFGISFQPAFSFGKKVFRVIIDKRIKTKVIFNYLGCLLMPSKARCHNLQRRKVTQKRMWQSHTILHRRRATASTSGGKWYQLKKYNQSTSLWVSNTMSHDKIIPYHKKNNTQTKIIHFHSKASWCALICSGLVATYVWFFLKVCTFQPSTAACWRATSPSDPEEYSHSPGHGYIALLPHSTCPPGAGQVTGNSLQILEPGMHETLYCK